MEAQYANNFPPLDSWKRFNTIETQADLGGGPYYRETYYAADFEPKYLKKKWLIKTTLVELQRRLEPYAQIPEFPVDAFVECRGKFARLSANYTPLLASIVWAATMPHRVPSLVALFKQGGISMASTSQPCLPLWCSMITRSISLKSDEAHCPEAKAAELKELQGHADRGTWDLSTVMEHSE